MKKNARILITALAFTFLLSACSSEVSEVASDPVSEPCRIASDEDLTNINEGMISSKYRVESGFTADFSAEDIEAIKQVFPTYVSPRVFAANIP